MYKLTWDGTLRVCSAMGSSLLTKGTVGEAMASVDAVLGRLGLDGRSNADVRATCRALIAEMAPLTRRGGLEIGSEGHVRFCRKFVTLSENVMRAFNRAWRREFVAHRGKEVVDGMSALRKRDDPVVFYLVSSHQKPQKAHAKYQGAVLVDRFWRKALEGNAWLGQVKDYVKANKTITVQKAMGAPDYLLTRPNCRHQLIPMRTADVLGMGAKALKAKYDRLKVKVKRPITDEQRRNVLAQMKAVLMERIRKAGI